MGTNEIATQKEVYALYTAAGGPTSSTAWTNEGVRASSIKSAALGTNMSVVVSGTYATNELVKWSDIKFSKHIPVETYTYSLSVFPTSMSFPEAGNSQIYTVNSTKLKYIDGVSSGSAINVNTTASVSGTGFSVDHSLKKVTASTNSSTSQRTGTVTITLSESGGKSANISLTQSAHAPTTGYFLSASPYTHNFYAGGSSYGGGSYSDVYIRSYSTSDGSYSASAPWNVQTGYPSWITVSPTSGSDETYVTLTALSNPNESTRSGRVTFANAGDNDYITVTLDAKAHVTNYVFQFSNGRTAETMSASYDGSSTTFGVVSTKDGAQCSFSASSSASSWLTATVSGTTGVTVKATANTSETLRSGTITLTQTGSGKTITISVTQPGKPHVATYVFRFASTTATSQTFPASSAGGSGNSSIISTLDGVTHGFTAVSNATWLTVSNTSTEVNYTVTANPNTTMREGTITLKLNDSNKQLTIKVTQQPKEVEVSYIFKYSDSTTTKSMSFAAAATSGTVSIISETEPTHVSVPFTWTGKPDWVTITDGHPNTTIAVTKNTATAQRSATIIFHQTGSSKTLTLNISQTAGSGSYNIPFEFKNNSSRLFPAGTTVFFEKNGGGEQAVSTNTSLDSGASLGITRGWSDSDFPLRFVSNKISVPHGGPSNPSANTYPSTVNTDTAKVTINLYGS